MLKLLIKRVFAAVVIILFSASAAAQDFSITRFHSNIHINKDASFTVEEKITVQFHYERRGIFRVLPYVYEDELGETIRTPLDIISVTDEDGKEWETDITWESNFVNIRIGDPDIWLTGRQVYVITYKVENALLFMNDHDELYWNITGNEWQAPILGASADVFLPETDEDLDLKARCFAGSYGSRSENCNYDLGNYAAKFFARNRFGYGEGFTIALAWKKGFIEPPSDFQKFIWSLNLRENWIFFIPFAALIFLVVLWALRGKDPSDGRPVVVLYEPPKDNDKPLTPAETGTLIDETLDKRDITASIIYLGVKGFITIEDVGDDDFKLTKLRDNGKEITPFEKKILDKIFSGSDKEVFVSSLKNSFYSVIPTLKNKIFKQLVGHKFFARNPINVKSNYSATGILIMVVGFFTGLWFLPGMMFKTWIALGLTGLLFIIFSKAMPVKTRRGVDFKQKIKGFQEFLDRAEKDVIERLGIKDIYYEYLPYAMALDVADNWSKSFEGIFNEPPDWYISRTGFTAFSTYSFMNTLDSVTNTVGKAMYTAPRGSGSGSSYSGGGFSGGGFSGGGFGGGGGGSW